MKRRLALVLLLLAGGAIVNVAVALRFVVTTPNLRYWTSWHKDSFPLLEEDDGNVPSAGVTVGSRSRTRQNGHVEIERWSSGLRFVQALPPPTGDRVSHPTLGSVPSRFEIGWPVATLATPWVESRAALNAVVDDAGIQWQLARRMRVLLWRGFAINTVFYAAILWLLFAGPFALRRRRRIKRGLCPKCAYPVGTSDVCTECGGVVRAARV